MAIPQTVKEEINEYKSPGNRLVLKLLIIALIAVTGALVKQVVAGSGDCENEKLRLRIENDSMKFDAIRRGVYERQGITDLMKTQDSTIKILEKIIRGK